MAAGDANRVWFPEMIETLRSQWNGEMPFPVLIELCNILDAIVLKDAPYRGFEIICSLGRPADWH